MAVKAREGEDFKKKDESEIEGWDLLMGHYHNLAASMGPTLSRFKEAIVNNWFIRNFIIASYALATY